jgi:hypothetical protein
VTPPSKRDPPSGSDEEPAQPLTATNPLLPDPLFEQVATAELFTV